MVAVVGFDALVLENSFMSSLWISSSMLGVTPSSNLSSTLLMISGLGTMNSLAQHSLIFLRRGVSVDLVGLGLGISCIGYGADALVLFSDSFSDKVVKLFVFWNEAHFDEFFVGPDSDA